MAGGVIAGIGPDGNPKAIRATAAGEALVAQDDDPYATTIEAERLRSIWLEIQAFRKNFCDATGQVFLDAETLMNG